MGAAGLIARVTRVSILEVSTKDFGLKEFDIKSPKERIRRYRRYVYEAGAISRPDKMQARLMDDMILG